MVTTRVLGGLVLAASVAVAGPASAQLWPNGGGPSTDVLRNSQEQWQRLAPPPVDAERVASLPIAPPVESRVDVGTPVLALPDQPPPRARTATATTRRTARRTQARRGTTTVRSTDESRLERDIEVRQRRLDELQRQIEADRARLEQRRGGLSSFNPVPPAAASTLPPSAPPPTATLR